MKFNKELNGVAYFISVIFHPIFIPIYISTLVYITNNFISVTLTLEQKFLSIALAILNFLILPTSLTAIWLKITQSHISMKTILSERVTSLLIFGISYIGIGLLLAKLHFCLVLAFISFFASIICLIIAIVTMFIKISIHVTSWSALITLMIILMDKFNYDFSIILISAMFIIGIVAWSRKFLEAHTNTELIFSYVIGIIVPILLSFI